MSYAMHVGRVGALAVALGIGLAVANTPGVAWAAPDTGADPSEVSGQAPDQKDDDKGDPPDGGPLNGSVDPHDSGDSDDADDKVESGDSGTPPGGMQMDSSGGAVTSTKPGIKGAQAGNEDVADIDKDRALPERKRLRAGKPDSRAQAALVPKKPKHLVVTASAPPNPSAEGLDAKERASALRVAPSNGRADQVVQPARPVAEIATVTPSVVVAPEPEPTNLMSRVLSLVTLAPAAGDGQPAGGESPLFQSCLAACRRVSQQASMEDEKRLRVADPTETSLMLAEADSGAQLMMAMAAVTVDPPTVGAPDQVTGAVSGSLNGYTVTGAPASGTVTVIGDTYTYTPTVPARLRAALTTQPDYDSFPVALSGQPAATVTVPVLPAMAATESSVPLGTGSNPSAVAVYGNLTYVANATARTVKVINTDTNQVIATVPVQTSPSAIAVSPDGKAVWVANAGSRTVQRIDTQSKTVVATVTVGTTPTALAVTADSVWVANAGSRTVQRIDTIPNRTTTNKVVATTTVGSTPSAIAVSGDRVYVANKSGNSISVISASTNKVISTKSSVTAPSALAVTDGKLYVTQQTLNRVLVLNSASMAQITTISVQSAPTSVAISRDGSLAYVASSNDRVSVIDTKANTVLSTVVTDTGTPTGGHAIAIDGTGTNTDIYLTDAASDSLRVLSVVRGNTAPFGGAATVNDPDTTIGVVTGSVIATDADGDALTYSVTGQPSAGGTVTLNEVTGSFSYQPSDPARDLAATTPNQDFTTFTVTATDRQAVTTIPVTVEIAPTQSTPQLAPTTTQISLGAWPDFLATKGSRVYVLNAGESTVSVIDTNTNTVIDTSDQLSAGGAMVLSPDGKLYVAEYIGNRVLVLDSATLEQVDTINVTTTYGGTLAVSQDGERLYVGSTKYDLIPYYDEYGNPYLDEYGNPYYFYANPKGSVSVVNTETKVVETIAIPASPSIGNVELSPDGKLLYANAPDRVHVINAATNTYVTSFGVGGQPADVAFSPDSTRAYITNLHSGELYVIDTVTNAVIAKPVIDTTDYRYIPEWDYTYEAGFPTDLAVSKDGSRVYVARGDDIVVVDAVSNTVINEIRVATDIPNNGAQSLTIADNGTIYITLEDTVVAVNTMPPAGSGMVSETLGAANPGQTSLMLVSDDGAGAVSESFGSAGMASLAVMAMAAVPAVPTVGAPNLVTGTVTGSLNAYTVTGETASGKVAVDGVSEVGSRIIVRNWAELDAALGAANAGSTIHMRAGEYVATHALVIPEGVALEGEGRMLTNRDGSPIGFAPKTLTTLRATGAVQGDFITMLDGSTLRNIQIIDTEQARPLSNVVAIVSQHPFDSIEADIIACEIQNYGVSGVGPNGPTGRAVLIVNRTLQAPPPVAMHEGSSLDVRITRSLIRSFNNGSGVFAINFAADSSITLELSHNYIGGGLDVAGGVSRPLEVSNSVTAIRSHHNLYRSDHGEGAAPAAMGWSLLGGTGPPPPLPIPSTHDNTLLLTSSHDRIEGFRTAINASAARRTQPTAGPSNNNTLVVELTNARLSSIDADIRISAAETLNPSLTPGDNNVTIFRAHNVIGSGPRQNYFGHARFSPPVGQPSDLDASLAGNGNRLEITGTAVKFERHNHNIQPGPGSEFFTGTGLPIGAAWV